MTTEGKDPKTGTEKPKGAGAPVGNKNSSRDNRMWRKTIERVLAQGANPDRLRRIAEKLLDKAEEGDLQAIKELGDRLDGKPSQQVIVNGDEDGGPVITKIEIVAGVNGKG